MEIMSTTGLKLSKFKVDPRLETEGIWVEVDSGLALRLARITAPAYEAFLRKKLRAVATGARGVRTMLQLESTHNEDAVVMEGIARFILLDWRGLLDDDGVAIPYSPENALAFFTEYPDFYRLVVAHATDYEALHEAQIAADAGNLSGGSSGSSNTEVITPE